jgi:beta-lactam-binding protein with PASTA domain
MTTNRHRRRLFPACSSRVVAPVTLALLLLGSLTVVPAAGLDLTEAALVRAEGPQPPNVVGLTLPEARTLIEQQWYPKSTSTFAFKVTVQSTGNIPEEVPESKVFVLSQTVVLPQKDTSGANPKAVISLTVGSAVPDLVGHTLKEAQGLLDAVGLRIKATGDGSVVRQSPGAGRMVPFGTLVTVVLAPPPPNGKTVPTLLGLTETQASAAVKDVDLKLVVTASSGKGKRRVTGQDPLPGTELQVGEVVSVTLRGTREDKPTVVVPDVTGLKPHIVQQVLSDAELRLTVDPSGTHNQGLSFRQNPQPGERVTPGTPVTVTFAVAVAAVSEETSAAPWPWLGDAALLAFLGLALWSARMFRRRPAPAKAHPPPRQPEIRVDPHPDLAPVVSTHPTAPDADLVIRIVPGPDMGSLLLTRDTR